VIQWLNHLIRVNQIRKKNKFLNKIIILNKKILIDAVMEVLAFQVVLVLCVCAVQDLLDNYVTRLRNQQVNWLSIPVKSNH
jgi:hypothetical protein